MIKLNSNQLKLKSPLAILAVVILLGTIILIVNLVLGSKKATTPEPEPKKKTKVEEINIIPVGERPYIYLTPIADGRNVAITLAEVKSPATEAEYELEYQAGTLLQGAFGALKLDSLPFVEKVLFGSCSAGGACTYHTDIKGGSLLGRFINADGKYVVKSDWRYFDNTDKSKQVASKDAKFQLTADNLAKQRFTIVYNTPGYPAGLEGEVASDIYSLQTSSAYAGKGELILRAQQEGANLQIASWNGKQWQYYQGSIDGKTVTATVDLAELYLVVLK